MRYERGTVILRCLEQVALIVLSMITLSSSVFAESSSEALKAFGLVGAWSEDCTKSGSRATFATPFFNVPTLTISVSDGSLLIIMQFEIKYAVRVTEEKIKISAVLHKFTKDGQEIITPPESREPGESVWERVGKKIKSNRRESTLQLLEKCLTLERD